MEHNTDRHALATKFVAKKQLCSQTFWSLFGDPHLWKVHKQQILWLVYVQ